MEHKPLPCQALMPDALRTANSQLHMGDPAYTAQWELSKQHMALFFTNHREEKDHNDVFLIGGGAQRAEFCLPKI